MTRAAPRPKEPFFTVHAEPGGERRVEFHPENVASYARDRIAEHADQEISQIGERIEKGIERSLKGAGPAILACAASGALLYNAARTKTPPKASQAKVAMGSGLQEGARYALQVIVDPKHPTWQGDSDLKKARAYLRRALEHLGWSGDGSPDPQIRNADAARAFLAGEPAEWIWSVTWTKGEARPSLRPAWAPAMRACAILEPENEVVDG